MGLGFAPACPPTAGKPARQVKATKVRQSLYRFAHFALLFFAWRMAHGAWQKY